MLYNTIQTNPVTAPSIPRRQTLTRNSSSMASRPKTSSLTLTNITKTISNFFIKAQKLPQAIQERVESKIIAKPFYTKNRKLISIKSKETNQVPNGFKNMLRAKSTVIKQKKLQQFYINKEGREAEEQRLKYCEFIDENNKSNLFRSNVPFKRARHRNINSMNLERKAQMDINHKMIQMPGKAMTIHAPTQDMTQFALKERKFFATNSKNMKDSQKSSTKIQWHNFRKKKSKIVEKQNIQFQIEPWNGTQNDDILF